MNEGSNQARALAAEALSDLADPDVSLEVSIRKAIRAAALRGHVYWRDWLTLQTIDIAAPDHEPDAIKRYITSMLAESQSADDNTAKVAEDYASSRTMARQPGKLYTSSIGTLEEGIRLEGREMIAAEHSIPARALESIDEQRTMLDGIRNRVRDYLTSAASGS